MPCRGPDDDIVSVGGQRQKKEIDLLTRQLCYACTLLEHHCVPMPELSMWWERHKKEDAKRKKDEERQRASAKAKEDRAAYLASVKKRVIKQLTDDEREALGIARPK